ncbi:hypothetical protein Sa4125_06050 [Aureimonas sp. SA4125]|uniref:endonuclease domain-containing protein n=1 Tax=Aureimonas sp. SA4125 TaxID=2826993 RepID=UPI001CC34DC9|nr:DUF559 domain-containing protein [Aureimonas sp. SA4125]BDA83063.1 hypothetical protein Sa4125_06050 [Aureimonas sp. SA4125]
MAHKPMTRRQRAETSARRRVEAEGTAEEAVVWQGLRLLPDEGRHFLRQQTLGPYLTDFVSHRLRLIVEIDGDQHGFADKRRKDSVRDAWLAGEGYRVLRFWNREVRADPAAVLDSISRVVEERRTLPPADPQRLSPPVQGKPRPRPG